MSRSRILVSSGTDFESTVGYSRAVRVGPHIVVAGTTGPGPVDDIGGQTREALRRIEVALNQVEATLSDVARARIYPVGERSRQSIPRFSVRSAPRPPWSRWRR